ncbi:MAG: aldose 1-epimerase family protein [Clostridia bacterium]|nr:aldose 1-epimerase family protein [Clostridia bacterium]
MIYNLENDILKISVDTHGAELSSIFNKKENKEMLWHGDPQFWGRRSPVLFPVVGKYKNGKTTYSGKEYALGQHGFARDSEFTLVEQNETKLVFALESSEETLTKYPFKFRLVCSFKLKNDTIIVGWKVENIDDKTIYFSIGAHPAFYCEKSKTVLTMNADNLKYSLVNADGLYTPEKYDVENSFVLHDNIFDKDALIIENSNVTEVSLVDDNKKYITVKFDAPLFGIWSPTKKNAPFVCIEPWYGRCDGADFNGDITEREWSNSLSVNETWYKEYEIIIHE